MPNIILQRECSPELISASGHAGGDGRRGSPGACPPPPEMADALGADCGPASERAAARPTARGAIWRSRWCIDAEEADRCPVTGVPSSSARRHRTRIAAVALLGTPERTTTDAWIARSCRPHARLPAPDVWSYFVGAMVCMIAVRVDQRRDAVPAFATSSTTSSPPRMPTSCRCCRCHRRRVIFRGICGFGSSYLTECVSNLVIADLRSARPLRRHRTWRASSTESPPAPRCRASPATLTSCGNSLSQFGGVGAQDGVSLIVLGRRALPGLDAGLIAHRRLSGLQCRTMVACRSACAATSARPAGLARRAHRAAAGDRRRATASSKPSAWRATRTPLRGGEPAASSAWRMRRQRRIRRLRQCR